MLIGSVQKPPPAYQLSTPHSEQPLQRMAHALWEPRDGCQLLQGGGFMSREVFRGGDDV